MTAAGRTNGHPATARSGRGTLHQVMPEHHSEAVRNRPTPRASAPDAPRRSAPAGLPGRCGAALAGFRESVRIGSATLIRADALDVLAALAAQAPGTLGAVLADPPYCSGGPSARERARPPSQKYQQSERRHLHAAFAGDMRDQRSFLAWSSLWMARAREAVVPGGLIGAFTDWRQLPVTTDALQVAGWVWRGIVPWDKTEAVRPALGRYRTQAEYLVWGSNGPRPMAGATAPGVYAVSVPREKLHMAAKPVRLMEQLLAIMDGPVLDPFMGSGTVGVACLTLGLPYIGIEVDPGHFAVACQRLEEVSRAESSAVSSVRRLAPAGAGAAGAQRRS